MKIAVGMIMQETNSFSTIKTDIDDFLYSPLVPLLEGPDLLEEHRKKPTERSAVSSEGVKRTTSKSCPP